MIPYFWRKVELKVYLITFINTLWRDHWKAEESGESLQVSGLWEFLLWQVCGERSEWQELSSGKSTATQKWQRGNSSCPFTGGVTPLRQRQSGSEWRHKPVFKYCSLVKRWETSVTTEAWKKQSFPHQVCPERRASPQLHLRGERERKRLAVCDTAVFGINPIATKYRATIANTNTFNLQRQLM